MQTIPVPKRVITYEYYGAMADTMVGRLRGERFTHVYGIPRGGMPLAVHMSHHLGVPLVTSGEILTNMNLWTPDDRLLVVDDIINHGKSISGIAHMLTIRKIKHLTAVLFYKSNATFKPDVYIETSDTWIVFPWEHEDEAPKHT